MAGSGAASFEPAGSFFFGLRTLHTIDLVEVMVRLLIWGGGEI